MNLATHLVHNTLYEKCRTALLVSPNVYNEVCRAACRQAPGLFGCTCFSPMGKVSGCRTLF